MKFKRKRALEVPPKIRCFINRVAAFPLENIQEPLKNFAWEFDKGDFHHWVDLFNHFDSFFEKYVKPRKDLQIDDGFLDSDPPFPREAVLQILRVIRIILDNCTNKHFYSSYEQHLSSLLSSTDPDVVEATLDTLAAFLKKTIGKYSIRDASLNSKLFALAQGWGGKEEGLGLVASAVSNDCDPIAHDLGCALHFEFYAVNESESDKGVEPLVEGLQIIHLNDVHKCVETDLELLHKLVTEYKVPSSLRFSLLTRLRFARAFGSLGSRQQYTCIRLYAFIVLIQACGDADDLVSFFNAEPGFINELISLLSYEDAVLEKIRVLCLHSLAALCQDRSRQPSVLTALTSGGHRGILSSLMQKSINSVISDTSKWSVHFAEALLSLVTVLVSSSSGCSAMREAGFIPTLLPLLKDINPQHLHLVEKAVRILEAFMDYSNPAAALFRDLGGLDDTISRLKIEISHVENGGKQPDENSESSRSAHMVGGSSVCLDDMQPLYSEPLISYHRRSLMKALLRAISLGTYAPGNTTRDTPASLSSGLDELMRHASSLRGPGVDMLVEILETISKIGSAMDPSSLCHDPCSSTSAPMEMDGGDKNLNLPDSMESSRPDDTEQINEPSSDASTMNIESYLPDCVNNVARLLETILQNADTCRIFVEKKGIEAILQLFTMPLMPPSVSVGQSISVAFKNFSPQHYVSLARDVCSFLREHLKSTNEVLDSTGGTQLPLIESAKQSKVLKHLSSLEGILALSVFLLKGTTAVVSELSTSDADVLKDIGRTYKEIIWQISLCNDSKTEEKKNNDQESDISQGPSSTVVERESDDDTNMQTVRYTNPVFARNGSHSMWSGERDFVSVVRSGEGLHRRTRQGIARMRGGRAAAARRLEALNIDSEASSSALETSSSQDLKKKSPDVLALEILNKLASTMRSFFTALVKGFTSPNRRRADSGSLSSASKALGTVLATNFLEALSFSGHSTYAGLETSLSVKCRYLGKVVDDMAALTFDSRRRSCYTAMVNNFYVHGTFKELLTTYEATSQLLWTLPCSTPSSDIDLGKKGEGAKLSHNIWLLYTLQSYCRLLEYFVNSSLLLSPTSASQSELLVQPVAVGLSIGLFPVPRDPEVFVRMLQSQEDDELARALALSLGSSSETTKVDNAEKTIDVSTEEGHMKKPPVADILAASVKLFHSSDSVAFQLSDLLVTLCNQNKGEDRPKVLSYLLQQLKLCPLDFSTDNCALGMLAHVITLLLFEDGSTREVAAQNGIISTIIDILTNLKGRPELGKELPVSKCLSALLLILDLMLQSRTKTENTEAGSQTGSMPDSSGEHGSLQFPDTVVQEEKKIDGKEKEHCMAFENEKEKEKSKSSSTDATNECLRISESKSHDGSGKYLKSHKKVPVNVTQVIDQLLEIVLKYPPMKGQEDSECESTLMDIDESNMKVKGKSKVEETVTLEPESERSTEMVKVIFVLKLLSDILLMYGHAVGVILRRDSEMCQFRGSNQPSGQNGIIHHVLHRLLSSIDKSAGPGDWRGKLSEKASWFLVVLCGRSGEGRKRVTNGLVKELMSFSNFESNSLKSSLSPDKRLFAFVDLVYSILSKNSSSGSLPGSGYSPEIAKSLIDGGIIKCLTSILQVVDLDHPDAPKFANLVLKGLECLSRAANASEQVFKSDVAEKRRSTGLNERSDDQITAPSVVETVAHDQNASSQEALRETMDNAHHQRTSQGDHHVGNPNQSGEQDMRVEEEEAIAQNPPVELGMDFMREELGDDGVLHNPEQIEMTFHVENRVDNDMGDEDDDMGDDRDDGDDDDEDDDDDGEDEDEDIAEDGGGMMSMADTDVEDHDDSGDEYNNEMFDVDDDDFHENRVIEVRWREALDGLDHLQMQILGQPGTAGGLIDVAAEPFEGVNVDDLFRLQSFERRRQTGRSSFERPASEINGFQHPLFVRPPQSGDFVSMWSSGGTSASRDSEALSSGNPDAAHFYMFDAPILSYDHLSNSLFGDHMGSVAPPPLTDYSVGMGSLHLPGRRVLGNGRWTDDGQPQGGAQAAAIAQAVEGQFLAQMGTIASASSPTEQQVHNSEDQEKQSDALPSHDGPALNVGADSTCQQIAGQEQENGTEIIAQQINLSVDGAPLEEGINVNFGVQDTGEGLQTNEPMSVQPLSLNIMPNGLDCTVNEINVTPSDNVAIPQEFVNSSIEPSADVPTNSHNVPVVPMVCNGTSNVDVQPTNPALPGTYFETPNPSDCPASSVYASVDVDMSGVDADGNQSGQPTIFADRRDEMLSNQNTEVPPDDTQAGQTSVNNEASGTSTIDPTFLEALPEDLRAEVLASQQAQSIQPPVYAPPSGEDIDPEFLAALPPDIQAEVLAQQRAQRVAQQAEGHPVDMDNASIIATFPADLREEVLLTSSEAVLSALPSPLLAEAQILRDRAMIHYQARSLFGSSHRLNNRRNGLGFVRRPVMDRGVGVTIDRRSALTDTVKVKEIEGEPLLNANALKALIRLLRLAQPLGKGLLQRLLLNLSAHSLTRATLIYLLLDMIKPEVEGSVIRPVSLNSQRLYGCHSNTVYGRSQLVDGLPPLVFRRILEILTYLATNHSAIAKMLFHFDQSIIDSSNSSMTPMNGKGKEKVIEGGPSSIPSGTHVGSVPLVFFLKLLNQPLFLRSTAHLEQVMGLIQVIVDTAASKLESQSQSEKAIADTQNLSVDEAEKDPPLVELDSNQQDKHADTKPCHSNGKKNVDMYNVFLQLPQSDLRNVCSLLGREGLSDKMYMLAGEVLKKLAFIVPSHRKFFILELSESSHALTGSAVSELVTLQQTNMLGLSAGSMAGAAILRVLQALSSLISLNTTGDTDMESDVDLDQHDDKAIIWNLNTALEPLWQELSNCISAAEMQLGQSSFCPNMSNINVAENLHGSSTSTPLPPGTQRLLPFIEAFFVLCEKLQANESIMQQDHDNATAREVKESAGCSASVSGKFCGDSQRKLDGGVTFTRFAEKHRRLANAFIRQNPVGNNATFQPNPNSVYQTEHLSYFKFVGRVVGKALFDGQLLDVYFTRSFYKHILGVKVTYHDIEAVDPDYYKNLKWMLENDVSDIPDLTFSMDADEEKLILYEKNEVTDYELKPGGRNIRVTEETKHEYVDLVAEHLLTNAIRPQINSFLEGFSEMVPRELISIFNDKELELLISGLPEIDLDDLKANTEYTGYTVASNVVQWFWGVVKSFNKEDMARLLQFVTGTSKVPLEGFKALQGISGPQRFQIHKAYGAPDRLPSAHTCFNQLDLPEYTSKEQLQDRLLLAIHEASEGSSAIMSLTCHLKIGTHPGCYSVEERFYW
ncbi:E3 ubiquitin-protein ligase UPL1 [Trifolium repens]|nr:E3 ubiquitin-protein ligase UPL1 [Trifolium repens]